MKQLAPRHFTEATGTSLVNLLTEVQELEIN